MPLADSKTATGWPSARRRPRGEGWGTF
jgi:hypothetical protein